MTMQCKDRIEKELEGRIKDFQTALKKSEDGSFTIDGDDYEDFISWINFMLWRMLKTRTIGQ